MYALVNYIGSQILIKEGKKIKLPFLDKKIGSKVIFNDVLFYDDGKNKKIGNPYLKSISFSGKIESHGKEKKIMVFKKKRRKGYQKKNGHAQQFTYVTIDKFSNVKTSKKTKATSKPKASVPVKSKKLKQKGNK